MNKKKTKISVFGVIRDAVWILRTHKEVLFPFCIIAFVQLFILELVYFLPRFPLVNFFGPIIRKLWGEQYLHFPFSISLMPKLFQFAQTPVFIFITSFFVSMAVAMLVKINNDEPFKTGDIFKEAGKCYVHVVVASFIMFIVAMGFSELYGLLINRALLIRSTTGKFFLIKQLVLEGAPYANLMLNVFATTLFAYVIPIIVIEKKKVFSAIFSGLKVVLRAPIFTFFVVLMPALLYVPVLIIRSTVGLNTVFPEAGILLLLISIFVILMIDAVTYTAVTIFYLIKKEAQ